MPCIVDIRDENAIHSAVQEAVKKYGGIDVLVNNASAISLTGTLETPMKRCYQHNCCVLDDSNHFVDFRFDLMMGINTRGTYATYG